MLQEIPYLAVKPDTKRGLIKICDDKGNIVALHPSQVLQLTAWLWEAKYKMDGTPLREVEDVEVRVDNGQIEIYEHVIDTGEDLGFIPVAPHDVDALIDLLLAAKHRALGKAKKKSTRKSKKSPDNLPQ